MSKYWSNIVKKISPYVPGEQPKDKKYIKLNTNEKSVSAFEKVLKAISAAVNESLRLYPDPACESLRNTLAKYYGIKASEVFVGNGSDELLLFRLWRFSIPETLLFFRI